MNLSVLGDRIFVRPALNPDISSDGLLHLVSDNARSVNRGTVVAVGAGPALVNDALRGFMRAADSVFNTYTLDTAQDVLVRAVAADLKTRLHVLARTAEREYQVLPGDEIVFSPEAGEEIRFESEVLIVMKESDVLAVIG